MATHIDTESIRKFIQAEYDLVSTTLRDKGVQRFTKALGLGVLCSAIAYFGVYVPSKKKIARLEAEIGKAKAMSNVGAQYKELRDQLATAALALPEMKDREQWLSNAMIESLRAEGLIPESFRPVNENEVGGVIVQSSRVDLTIKFEQFYAWMLRLERTKPLMHVQSFSLQKKADTIGWNRVSCEVTTLIPKKRFN